MSQNPLCWILTRYRMYRHYVQYCCKDIRTSLQSNNSIVHALLRHIDALCKFAIARHITGDADDSVSSCTNF